uniref:Uncharacterized protein n=1 Tax=Ananas comosus var. bracteatus TaxID=296719 RepID=A0A6V7P874_ANACO|nr:unnamed protein product [Ananas comosus var. bracteatus]
MNQRPPPPPFAPGRISFSTDFALDQPPPRPPPAAAADFEFAGVGSRPMMAADQLFFKGRILPFKDTPAGAHPHHAAAAGSPPCATSCGPTTTASGPSRARPAGRSSSASASRIAPPPRRTPAQEERRGGGRGGVTAVPQELSTGKIGDVGETHGTELAKEAERVVAIRFSLLFLI